MQAIDSGSCRTSSNAADQSGATQNFTGFRGSLQDRADQLVRATVLSDLGQSAGQGRHGHGIHGIAAAIRKALSAQDVTGTDAADDVLKKIEASLHKAAQALADRGVDAKTIDATIDRFRAQLANALDGMAQAAASSSGNSGSGRTSDAGSASGSGSDSGAGAVGTSSDGASGDGASIGGSNIGAASSGGASGTGSAGLAASAGSTSGTGVGATSSSTGSLPWGATSVSSFAAREVRKERGTIDLITAEGDRVSIRFRTKEVVAGSVTQSTAADGTTTTANKASLFSRGGVKIDVDGDLNADELKAINDLLGKVDDIATKFFSGDVQAAFSAATSLGVDSDQIAAYRLNLTYSRKIAAAYGAYGAAPPVSMQPPASTSTDDGTPSTSATNAGNAPSDSVSATDSSGNALSPSGSEPASGTSSTAGSAASSASDSASGNSRLAGSTASDARTGIGDGAPATTPPASAQKTIIDFLSDALSKLSSANGAGRLSFSMQWKMSVLVTALESVQPAQPTTSGDQAAATNTQLLGDSLQKIAAA